MNEKLNLALNEFIHVGVVLILIIAIVSILTGLIRAFIPQEKIQKRLSKTGKYSGFMGALLGIPTPFCSASMVPVSMGMIEMGAPFAMVFSFLLSAPLANFVVVGFIFGVFGWKVALVYFLIVFIGSVVFGSIAGKTSLKHAVKRMDLTSKTASNGCGSQPTQNCTTTAPLPENACNTPLNSCTDSKPSPTGLCSQTRGSNPKLTEAFNFGWSLFKRIFPYVLLGAVISAVSAVFVPDAWVEKYLGNDSPLAIPIAATVGSTFAKALSMFLTQIMTLGILFQT